MINELSRLVPKFPGATNQTRCFLHILNLVVKSVIKQFDLLEMQADNILNDAHQALLELAKDLEHKELQSQKMAIAMKMMTAQRDGSMNASS